MLEQIPNAYYVNDVPKPSYNRFKSTLDSTYEQQEPEEQYAVTYNNGLLKKRGNIAGRPQLEAVSTAEGVKEKRNGKIQRKAFEVQTIKGTAKDRGLQNNKILDTQSNT